MTATPKPDTEHRDKPVCPHCGSMANHPLAFVENDENGDSFGSGQCVACSKWFTVIRHQTTTWSTVAH